MMDDHIETTGKYPVGSSTPERSCSAEKFRRILDAVLKGSSPKDDTMLEKLGEWFKKKIHEDETFLDQADILNHITELNRQKVHNAHAIAFFLKILSYISLDDLATLTDAVLELYDKVLRLDCWVKSAAVRCAWLIGFKNFLTSEKQLQNLTKWMVVEEGRLETVLGCTADTSIFVSKAAIELVAQMVSAFLNCDNSIEFGDHIWALLYRMMTEDTSAENPAGYLLLQIIEQALALNSAYLAKEGNRDYILDKIWSILKSKKMNDAERNTLMSCLNHFTSILPFSHLEKFQQLPEILLEQGDVKSAMTVANWLLIHYCGRVTNKSSLEDMQFISLMAIHSETTEALNPTESSVLQKIHQQLVTSITSFPGVFLHQLFLMQEYNQVYNIPLSKLEALEAVHNSFQYESLSVKQPLLNSLKNKDKVQAAIFNTLMDISHLHPLNCYKPLMVRYIMSSAAHLMRQKSIMVVQKSLACILAMTEFILKDFDTEKEMFLEQSKKNQKENQKGKEDATGGVNKKDCSTNHEEKLTQHDDVIVSIANAQSSTAQSSDGVLNKGNQKEDAQEDDDSYCMVEEAIHLWSVVIVVVFQRLMCDPRWEAVDCALESLTKVLTKLGCVSIVQKSFIKSHLGGLDTSILGSLSHPEGYIRSSGLKCLGEMAKIDNIWTPFLLSHPKEEILTKVINVIRNDSEAFARRAAVNVLTIFYHHDSFKSVSGEIFDVMCSASLDFDYEVRMNALDFWNTCINPFVTHDNSQPDEVPEYARCLFTDSSTPSAMAEKQTGFLQSQLVESGCLKSLLVCAKDCDKTVQNKSCLMLCQIKKSFEADQMLMTSIMDKDNLVQDLLALDLQSLLTLSELSTDQYDLNPETLLDDILTSVQVIESDASDNEDNAIDCY